MSPSASPRDATARALIERVLRSGASIAPEYPTLFHENAAGAFVTVEDGGATRAACAILPRELAIGAHRVRVGLVGSVVTDPAHQRRGHATRLLEAAEKALRDNGCALALLWADDRGFYARRGWREIGCERDFVLTSDAIERLPASDGCRAMRAGDADLIHSVHATHERRAERTPEETRSLLACPGMRVLVREAGASVTAYACLGRGRDLARVIHEWGGPADDVLRLVRAHLEEHVAAGRDDELYLMAPGAHGELHGRLALAGVPSAVGVLGVAKLLDARPLAEIAAKELGATARSTTSSHPELVELAGPSGTVTILAEELVDVLFAARGERGAARDLATKLGTQPGALPLAPFVWGLDSI